MIRKETEADLKNEQECKELLEKVWGYKVRKLGGNNEFKYLMDFILTDENDKAVRFVEFKARRSIKHDTFKDGVLLGLQKFNKGAEYYHRNHLDFFFVAWFENGFYAYRYDPSHDLQINYASRCQNQEPVVLIKPEYWEEICQPSDTSKINSQETGI